MQCRDGGAVPEPVRHNNCSATIVNFNGRLFLHIITDTHLWVGLPHNFNRAVKAINKELDNWPDSLLSQLKRNLSDMSQIRKLDLKLKKMNMKKNMKKTKSNTISPTVALLEKNTGFQFQLLNFPKKPSDSFFWPGAQYDDGEQYMQDQFEQLKIEQEYDRRYFETLRSNEDSMIDDGFKDGSINEGAGTSEASMEKNKSILT